MQACTILKAAQFAFLPIPPRFVSSMSMATFGEFGRSRHARSSMDVVFGRANTTPCGITCQSSPAPVCRFSAVLVVADVGTILADGSSAGGLHGRTLFLSSSTPHRFAHHPSRGAQHERYCSVLTNVGFAATRPTSRRSRSPLQALPCKPTSSPSSREFIASSRRLDTSSIPFGPLCANRDENAGPSIAIGTRHSHRFGLLRGFLSRGLFDACPQAPHGPVREGRHRITLNVSARSWM